MVELPQVSICAVDTRTPDLALRAICRSRKQLRFADAFIMADRIPEGLEGTGVRFVEIPPIRSVKDYSEVMLTNVFSHFSTSHVLIVQWDGFVVNPDMWNPIFLDYDYIGAVWPRYNDDMRVGNGGFSLRSRRLLEVFFRNELTKSHPEDVCIGRINRRILESRYGFHFASEAIANRFSTEWASAECPSFGFHGFFRFPDFFADEELFDFVKNIPVGMLKSEDSRKLCKYLLSCPTQMRLEIVGYILESIGLNAASLRGWVGVRSTYLAKRLLSR